MGNLTLSPYLSGQNLTNIAIDLNKLYIGIIFNYPSTNSLYCWRVIDPYVDIFRGLYNKMALLYMREVT